MVLHVAETSRLFYHPITHCQILHDNRLVLKGLKKSGSGIVLLHICLKLAAEGVDTESICWNSNVIGFWNSLVRYFNVLNNLHLPKPSCFEEGIASLSEK